MVWHDCKTDPPKKEGFIYWFINTSPVKTLNGILLIMTK